MFAIATDADYVDASEASNSTPEKLLLANILDRALRDLVVEDSHTVKSAIAWFENPHYEGHLFTYLRCADVLGLSVSVRNTIKKEVERVKYERDGQTSEIYNNVNRDIRYHRRRHSQTHVKRLNTSTGGRLRF